MVFNLAAAFGGLVLLSTLDYSVLESAVGSNGSFISGVNSLDYTVGSWSAYYAAWSAALAMNSSRNASSQSDIDTLVFNLAAAFNGLSLLSTLDYSVLQNAVNNNKSFLLGVNPIHYTVASWSAYINALNAAIAMNTAKNATSQSQINSLVMALNIAFAGLTLVSSGLDYSNLEVAINSVVGLNPNSYTPNSWFLLQTNLANAQFMNFTRSAVTQTEINNLVNALNTAKNNLVLNSGNNNPGKRASSLSVFLDVVSNYGYIVGEVSTISWTTQGIVNLNQKATLTFLENGKVLHIVNVLLSDGSYKYKFSKSHKTLDIVLSFDGDDSTYSSSAKVSTFVDLVNLRRTFIEIKNMDNLLTAKKGNINIVVYDYKGNIIKNGKVSLTFDNKWTFTVAIQDGVANFSHTYLKAGDNRTLKISYIKNGNNMASSKTCNVRVNKGTPKVNLAISPNKKILNNKVKLNINVSGVIFGVQKKWYNTIKFFNNGILQHQLKVPIKSISYNKGLSVIDYTFKKSHSNMTIQSIFNGNSNYYSGSDSVKVVLRKTN